MNTFSKRISLFVLLCLPALSCFASGVPDEFLDTRVSLISLFEFILFVTSLVSIKQFFWKGPVNRTPFQIFNMLFVVVFYTISYTFLLRHKNYWEGYEHLTNSQCIEKHLFSTEPFAIIKKLILVAFVLNIIYVIRHGKDYYVES